MTWAGIEGHDQVVERFRRALGHGRLASTFLFVGPAGVGKRTFAERLAQALLCEARPGQDLNPCGRCPACQQVDARTHPDLEIVSKPSDKSNIPLELFIGDKEHRMRDGLCYRLSLKPYRGGRRIAIIDDADFLSVGQQEGANCLLKTLEEPPPRSILILIGTSEQKQLPTIRSRCQVVRFQPLPEDTVAKLLVATGLAADAEQAGRLAALSGGSLAQAVELADEPLGEFRQSLLAALSQPDWNSVELSKAIGQFVDDAGKEAPPRRARLLQVIGFAIDFYRQLLRSLSSAVPTGDDVLRRAVGVAQNTWRGDGETAADCLDRCIDAITHIQSNANPSTVLDCWLDDLSMMTRTGRALSAQD